MKYFSNDNVKKYYVNNRIPILGMIFFSMLSLIWLSNSTVNVPVMDYWRYINELTEKVYRGGFSFVDMWVSMGGHREGLHYLFTALNISYFGMNALIGIYGGLFVNTITIILIYIYYNRKIISIGKRQILKKILFLLIPLALFSFNQWEIYTLEFSFSFALRRILYLIAFILIEKMILNYEVIKKYTFEVSIFLLIIMLFMSGGYLAAFIGAILFSFIIDIVLNYKEDKTRFGKCLIITSVMILGLIIYMHGLSGVSGEGQSINNLINGIFNGSLFKGVFIMLGASVLDSRIGETFGVTKIFASSGFIIFLIYLLSLCIYFSKKMWKRTYLPLFLMAYTGINILTIYYARGMFGVEYLSASRYSCETIMGIIGVCYILIEYAINIEFNIIKENRKKVVLYGISIISIVLIVLSLVFSYIVEFLGASQRKDYQNNLVNIMLNIDDYSNEQLAVFQANDPEQVRNGVYLMKKYKLGVFKDFDYEKFGEVVGSTLEKSKKLSGIWDDNWLANESRIKISTGENGSIYIKGYYPFELTNNLKGTIYINNVPNEFVIDKSNFELEFSAPKKEIVEVKIKSDFERQASESDLRKVSFILNTLSGK